MSAFREGSVICATSINDDDPRPFDVTIASSEPVGRGSTSYIFVGKMSSDDALGAPVALKVFTNILSVAEGTRGIQAQLLRRELRAARRVRHPHILPFIGIAITDLYTVILSPYMQNGDMNRFLSENPTADRNELILQLAQAVDHLHTVHKLVHGDLKCENALVSDDGKVLLADFGLSTFIDKVEGYTITTTGIRSRFTMQFAAPELLASESLTSSAPDKTMESDVYAFGMTVLQAFTGKPPWPGFGFQAIVREVFSRRTHPRPGAEITDIGLIDTWWAACIACWHFDPAERLSMHDLLTTLQSSYAPYQIVRELVSSVLQDSENFEPESLLCEFLIARSVPMGQTHDWCCEYRTVLLDEFLRIYQRRTGQDAAHTTRALPAMRQLYEFLSVGPTQSSWTFARLSECMGTSDIDTYETFPFHLRGHSDAVTAIAFLSPTRVISGSRDGTLRMWDILTGEMIEEPLRGHTLGINCVLTSPDSRCVASCSLDGTVRLWNFDAGRYLRSGPALRAEGMGNVWAVAFSPNGRHIFSGSSDGAVRVWDTRSGHLITVASNGHAGPVTSLACVALSAGSVRIASGGNDETLRIWHWDADAETLEAVGEPLTGHAWYVSSVAFSPDGSALASASWDNTMRIWDPEQEQPPRVLRGHSRWVNCVAFSHAGKHIASSSMDRTIRVWDAVTGETVGVLEGHTEAVSSIVFSPDDTRLVSGSYDRTVRVWDRLGVTDGTHHTESTEKEHFDDMYRSVLCASATDTT